MRLAHGSLGLPDVDVVCFVVPGRDAMPPPKLAANAPILNVTHPREVSVLPLLRYKLDGAGLNSLNRRLGELFGVDIPLRC